MAGPTSPGTEGPTFAPPQLPAGWIAQWDGASKKYYFVQLSTGVSQWDVPSDAAPTGSTPSQTSDHPYGVPRQKELITHPDGTQTVRHADGTMEPVNPPMPPDGVRALDGQTGDRGLGTMAMNAIVGGKHSGQTGQHGGPGSNSLGNLAGHFIGGGGHNGGDGKNPLGKIGGALASSLFHSGGTDKPEQPQNFHGGPPSGHQQHHGLAGSLMGGVANMFGSGKQTHGQGNDFGYSNSGGNGEYSGPAPPSSYQPPGVRPSGTSSGPAYHHSQQNQTNTPSYPPPPAQPNNAPYSGPGQAQPSTFSHLPPPPPGQPPATYGQSSYGQGSRPMNPPYGSSHVSQYGGPPGTYAGGQQGPSAHKQGYGSQY